MQEKNTKKEEAPQTMSKYGCFPVENDVISAVQMENAIVAISAYLRQLPKRMYEESVIRRKRNRMIKLFVRKPDRQVTVRDDNEIINHNERGKQ